MGSVIWITLIAESVVIIRMGSGIDVLGIQDWFQSVYSGKRARAGLKPREVGGIYAALKGRSSTIAQAHGVFSGLCSSHVREPLAAQARLRTARNDKVVRN